MFLILLRGCCAAGGTKCSSGSVSTGVYIWDQQGLKERPLEPTRVAKEEILPTTCAQVIERMELSGLLAGGENGAFLDKHFGRLL